MNPAPDYDDARSDFAGLESTAIRLVRLQACALELGLIANAMRYYGGFGAEARLGDEIAATAAVLLRVREDAGAAMNAIPPAPTEPLCTVCCRYGHVASACRWGQEFA